MHLFQRSSNLAKLFFLIDTEPGAMGDLGSNIFRVFQTYSLRESCFEGTGVETRHSSCREDVRNEETAAHISSCPIQFWSGNNT